VPSDAPPRRMPLRKPYGAVSGIARLWQASDSWVPRRDPAALKRFEQRGNPYARAHREGGGMRASVEMLGIWRRVRMLCGRCGSIVLVQVAFRAAQLDGRDWLVDTDGCPGSAAVKPTCSPYFQRGRVEKRQRDAAVALRNGEHVLIRRVRLFSDAEIAVVSEAERVCVANTLLELLDDG